MQYIKKDLGSFNLHMIKTDKFKTMTVKVLFERPIKREDITFRNVLTDVMLLSTEDYKTKRDLTIKTEELYSADMYSGTNRIGNYIITSFNIQLLNDKYTEEGNFEEAIKFLSSVIFKPDIKNGKFDEENINIVVHNTKTVMNSIKESAVGYGIIRTNEAFDKDGPICYRITGYEEDLDKIDSTTLYDYYCSMIDKDFVDIFVEGDFDEKEILALIKKYFKFRKVKKKNVPFELSYRKPRKRRLIAKEKIDNTQSILSIACSLSKLNDFEKKYVLDLANIIIGGGADSKLFKEIREKNSLCYSIFSFSSKEDHTLYIVSGIDRDNFDKTLSLITKLLNDLRKGKFELKDIDNAKELYLSSLEGIEDKEYGIISQYIAQEFLNEPSVLEKIKSIKEVKKSDIVKVFKKINMDTVFLLEGVRK